MSDQVLSWQPFNCQLLPNFCSIFKAEVWDINAAFEAAENDPSATDSKETLKNAFLTITGHDDVMSRKSATYR